MNVLMLSPGFPDEMPLFTEGLAAVGVRVIGIGEQPEQALPPRCRRALDAYHRVDSFWDERGMIAHAREIAARVRIDRVECLWEPGIMIAAQLREALGLPGMTPSQALLFRDKEKMKQALDEAGVRTPHHARACSEAECRQAAERIGYPLILKPIAGAGSADTHRVDGQGPPRPRPRTGSTRPGAQRRGVHRR